jgi:signal transduction histidine kinase
VREAHPEIQFHVNLTSDGALLSERTRLALYRVYQNAISNIVRHAQASRVDILFRIEAGEINLVIQDDGRGFNVPDRLVSLARSGHFGLVGMTERIEAIGGQLAMHSEPGSGTTIQVTVPLEAPMLAEN